MELESTLSLATASHAASFDCTKATGKVEKMICADSVLSQLDEEMASMHRKASDATADPVGFRQEHRQWLKKRNTCAEGGCVAQAYQERLAALRSLLRGPKPCFRLLERKWPEVQSGQYLWRQQTAPNPEEIADAKFIRPLDFQGNKL